MSRISHKQIAQVILKLSPTYSKAKLAKIVAGYLAQERRTSELDAVMREVVQERLRQDGLLEVDITSAFPLSASAKRQLKEIAGSDELIINETIDPDVIGGVRMETSETMLDLTVRNRLDTLKQGVITG